MKIKKGDMVMVISGKDRGKTGKVVHAFPKEEKVIVEGINLHKKHQRPTRRTQKGQIIDIAMPLCISDMQVVDPKSGKGTRIGYRVEKGKKIRFAKRSGTSLK